MSRLYKTISASFLANLVCCFSQIARNQHPGFYCTTPPAAWPKAMISHDRCDPVEPSVRRVCKLSRAKSLKQSVPKHAKKRNLKPQTSTLGLRHHNTRKHRSP